MKRLLRRTFVATSLLLSIVSLTLWITGPSWFLEAGCCYAEDRNSQYTCAYSIISQLGELRLAWSSSSSPKVFKKVEWGFYALPQEYSQGDEAYGWLDHFIFASRQWFHHEFQVNGTYRTDDVSIPLWLLTVVFSIPPLLQLRTHLRARREKKKGLCHRCGYDLRATPERCPECGAVPAAGSTSE